MAKDITIGGRDTSRASSSRGSSGGGCSDLIGKSGTVDRNGNVSWHGGEERKDGGGYPSGSNGYGGDHGGGSGGHGSYSGKHFDNGRPITRYGKKLVASGAAFKKAQDEQAQAIAQSRLSASAFAAAQAEATAKAAAAALVVADAQKAIADKAAAAHKVEYYARGAAADFKAKIIAQDIAIVQTEEGEKVLNLDNIYLTRDDMSALYGKLTRVSFDLDVMSLENTRIDGYAIKNIFTPAYPDVFHNIVYLNLANNNFGVYGASNIRDALTRGEMSATKYIDVSGNNITKRGEGFFIEALQNERVHDMIILTQRFDQNTKMVVGTKEEKAAFFNDLLKQGAEEGLYTVVDTNWWGQAKSDFNEDEVVAKGGAGFIKNKWISEDIVQSYVEGELIAKLPKDVENLVSV